MSSSVNSPAEGAVSGSPVKNKIGSVFIPVTDIDRARDWYCVLLGLNPDDCPVMSGHLCSLTMDGTGILLDKMPMWGGNEPGGPPIIQTPAFMFLTADLLGAYEHAQRLGVEMVTGIEHDHWFVVKDPDGNKIMICRE